MPQSRVPPRPSFALLPSPCRHVQAPSALLCPPLPCFLPSSALLARRRWLCMYEGLERGRTEDLLGVVGKVAERPCYLQAPLSLVHECARAHCAIPNRFQGNVICAASAPPSDADRSACPRECFRHALVCSLHMHTCAQARTPKTHTHANAHAHSPYAHNTTSDRCACPSLRPQCVPSHPA